MREVSAIDYSAPSEHERGAGTSLEQLAALADALVDQAGALRGHYEQLERTLDEALPEPEETVGGARPLERDRGEREARAPHVHDSARLVVMDMAISGSTREETKAYLRRSLDIEGGDQIVDEVFDRTEAAPESAPLHKRLFTRRRD